MTDNTARNVTLVNRKVTYHFEVDGQLFLIENVPAHINVETDEKLFSPGAVEQLQQLVRLEHRPVLTIKTPVYEFT